MELKWSYLSLNFTMLRIGKLTDYALIVLSLMARSGDRSFTTAELAEISGIAAPTTSKILKMLARDGIVNSTRGVKGGYALAAPPAGISVARVIQALEGPIAITECGLDEDPCQQSGSCHLRGNWEIINRAIRAALESVTLADMIQPVASLPQIAYIPLESIHYPSR
jgi:FeS assembly SUF system regulator